jgi:sugar phosphate isomerase/epimerase
LKNVEIIKNDFMITSRRNFIRYSASLGAGILFRQMRFFEMASSAANFLERIGVCTGISNNIILEGAGYSYVEESVRNFLIPSEDEDIFHSKLALLKNAKIPVEACNNFIAADLKSVGPAAVHDKILKLAETTFRRAQIAGIRIIVFGSGGSRSIPAGFSGDEARDQFISLCKNLGQLAGRYDIVITLEPLNKGECNFINSVAEGGEIVKAVNNRNFMLLADLYHMLRENESPDNLLKYKDYLCHTHIAGNTGRAAPGVNKEDFTPYFKALKEAGYNGRMSIECNWKDLAMQAGPALREIKIQLARINQPGV